MHGSITWNYNEEKEKLEEIGIQSSINFLKRSNYPHIIYPSTEKYSMSLNYEHYYELQTKFKECLNKKDSCLLVIGFSLKDNHIWKVINEALSNGNLIVFIFSSDNILDENNMILEEKVKEKFRDNLLNINGINFVCFENYNYEEYFMKSANYEFEQGFENKTNIINVKNEVIDND
ncbi:MAG: SIR2 family protein [Spiroplasma phoeniceum]|nr:MAG: SIR2 family protein [Spiroplasma phoeniceum]